jgi:amino acid permease
METFISSYFNLPFIVIVYFGYKFWNEDGDHPPGGHSHSTFY